MKRQLFLRYLWMTVRCGQKSIVTLLTVLIVCSAITANAQAPDKTGRSAAENQTLSLLNLHKKYQSAAPGSRKALALEMRSAAAARQQLLSSLIQTSPGEVLRVAIPNAVSAHMPASVRTFVEQTVQGQGVLEVSIEESTSGSKVHYGLTTAAGKLSLHFADKSPTHLLTGSVVRATGVQVGASLALACCSSSTSTTSSLQTVAAAALPNTFGTQNTLVILVNFQDNTTQPWTAATASSLIFGTGTGTVNGFYQDSSFGQTSLTGDLAGWYTIGLSSTSCNTSSIQSYAQQAAQNAGYVLSNYTRFVFAFPQTSACSWSGWSNIGGNPSYSWINGNMNLRVVAHELGHAFGLYHSHSLGCTSGGATVPYSSNCTMTEYGDQLDDMGGLYPMYFNASQKERLGWLNFGASPPITSVTTSGTYSLAPYETQDSQAKALKILRSGSSNSYYYIESRQFIGDDVYIQANEVLNGVLFHLSSPSDGNSSDILDMEPSNGWGFQAPALEVGNSYTDSAAGVTITPIAVSSTGATVQVTMSGSTCTAANPTVSISPAQSQWVTAGTPVSFTVTVADNDSSACNSATFNLAGTPPSGWPGVWSSSSLVLSPGASGSATYQVTSPGGTADGFYNVGVSANNATASSYSGSASGTYVVSTPTAAPVTLSVSTDQPSYGAAQTVSITSTVLSGASAEAGVSVTVTVTPPGGGRAKGLTGTTDSNGVAWFNYKLNRRATFGTYQVQASIPSTSGSSSTMGASTTFTVQ